MRYVLMAKKVTSKKNKGKNKKTAKTVSKKTTVKKSTHKKVATKKKNVKPKSYSVSTLRGTRKNSHKKSVKKVFKSKAKKSVKKSIPKVEAKPKYKPKAFTIKTGPTKIRHEVKTKKILTREQNEEELLSKGKERGFITYDEIIRYFPTIETDILFLEELYEKMSAANIDVLEGGNLLDMDDDLAKLAGGENTHDSIQMYLREIGQYPLI